MQAYILFLYTPSSPGVGSGSKHFLSEISYVAYQINWNGKKSTMQANILSLHTPFTTKWGQKAKTFLLKLGMLHIK